MRQFDLMVIGTGSAASTVAHECRSAGWEVAVIDSRPFGGTCALRGCDPKKVLVGAADVLDWARRMNQRGVRSDHSRIDWAELMHFKRTFTDPVPKSQEQSFVKAGISIPGEQYVTTSEQFLELEKLPERIVFIGGGYISPKGNHTPLLMLTARDTVPDVVKGLDLGADDYL